MIYKWSIPGLYSVDAQSAGEELQRIYSVHGKIDPADVVEESRAETATLHGCFEWDDAVAANKFRQTQAAKIIRDIVVVSEPEKKAQKIRAFVHVQSTYQPISIVVNDEEKLAELLDSAMRELEAFRKKYDSLSELSPVMAAIDVLTA